MRGGGRGGRGRGHVNWGGGHGGGDGGKALITSKQEGTLDLMDNADNDGNDDDSGLCVPAPRAPAHTVLRPTVQS